jgi:hypothetical protein
MSEEALGTIMSRYILEITTLSILAALSVYVEIIILIGWEETCLDFSLNRCLGETPRLRPFISTS